MKKRNAKKTVSPSIEKALTTQVKAAAKLQKILYRDMDNLDCLRKLEEIDEKILFHSNELRDHGYALGEIYAIMDAAK